MRLDMKRIIAIILVLTILLAVPSAHAVQMSDARSMLSMVNKFRTGNDTWYWNRDNRTVTKMTNLGILQYDPELEEVAKIRAKEISVLFEHTRPDGTDCFTAFPNNRHYMGENIACGYPTAADAFEGFLEKDENYAGQGHRRIMLMREFTRLGVAVVEVNGYPYWVMEFADAPDAGKKTTKVGWEQIGSNRYYRKADGSLVTGWLKQNGNLYLMNDDGVMQTGWQKDNGKWYYLNNNGVMQTGWLKDGGKWYYLNNNGVMQIGWLKEDKDWYYMLSSGEMVTGWEKLNNSGQVAWSYFKPGDDGRLVTGWQQIDGDWYRFDSEGRMQTGWLEDNNNLYYFRASGEMVTGTVQIDNVNESFSDDGVWISSQIDDYETPLSTESYFIRLIKAIIQVLLKLPGFE